MKMKEFLLYIEEDFSNEEIANELSSVYNKFNYDVTDVKQLQERVKGGVYEFGPLRVKLEPLCKHNYGKYPCVMYVKQFPDHVLGITMNDSDILLLDTIAIMLINLILKYQLVFL